MKIKMIESVRGSLDGVNVDDLVAGKEYETAATALGERMGHALIAKGVAVSLELLPEPEPEGVTPPVADKPPKAKK